MFKILYVQATLEIQTDYINKGARVLIVDDLLATGGKIKLIRQIFLIL